MTVIKNQKGQSIDGSIREEIIEAFEKGQDYKTKEGDIITIKEVSSDTEDRVLEINV